MLKVIIGDNRAEWMKKKIGKQRACVAPSLRNTQLFSKEYMDIGGSKISKNID
jgi:hypothetical protein